MEKPLQPSVTTIIQHSNAGHFSLNMFEREYEEKNRKADKEKNFIEMVFKD